MGTFLFRHLVTLDTSHRTARVSVSELCCLIVFQREREREGVSEVSNAFSTGHGQLFFCTCESSSRIECVRDQLLLLLLLQRRLLQLRPRSILHVHVPHTRVQQNELPPSLSVFLSLSCHSLLLFRTISSSSTTTTATTTTPATATTIQTPARKCISNHSSFVGGVSKTSVRPQDRK